VLKENTNIKLLVADKGQLLANDNVTWSLNIAKMYEGRKISKNIGTDLLFAVLEGLIVENYPPQGIHNEGVAEDNSVWMPQKIMSIQIR